MDEFYAKLAEILELDEVKPSDVLRDFPEWDSLSALSVIAMVNSDYRVTLTAAELKSADTAESLRHLIERKTGG